jgi:hypothetical protein
MTILTPSPVQQFTDNNGVLLAGGKLFTYAAGTTTKITTYTDSTGSTPNTNPVILNARGEAGIWLIAGTAYKYVLSPSTDTDPPTNPFYTVDQILASPTVAFTGDSGSGGVAGIVPAPPAGSAASNYFLGANGSWQASTTAPVANGTFMGNQSGGSAAPTAITNASVATALQGQTANTLAAGNDSRFTTTGQSTRSGNYTLALADAAVEQYFTANATLTIPANGSVAFPVCTPIPVRVAPGFVVTVAINTDTLRYYPSNATGSRTLTGPAYCVLIKSSSTEWAISAGGIS